MSIESIHVSDISGKVTAARLKRDAYLYIRQSTLYQVANNTESTARQYDLAGRAVALGWPRERIHVIDVDQGHSGASAADREGFQHLVAEVSLGRAGIVLGLECSRLGVPRGFRTGDPLGFFTGKELSEVAKTKNYSPEFREEAARMVVETSRAIASVAREIGVSETSLSSWVRAYREEHAEDEPPLQLSERARLRELERENRELRQKNEFLSKAAAYFASEHR